MKISLITACYNSAGTIRTAIESVLSQKGVDVEYIVVDGGSKDGTVDIIKEYADKTLNSQLLTPNFTLVIRPRNVIDSLGLTTGNMVECAK